MSATPHGEITQDAAQARAVHETLVRHGGWVEWQSPGRALIVKRVDGPRVVVPVALALVVVTWWDHYSWLWGPAVALLAWAVSWAVTEPGPLRAWLRRPWRSRVTCEVVVTKDATVSRTWS